MHHAHQQLSLSLSLSRRCHDENIIKVYDIYLLANIVEWHLCASLSWASSCLSASLSLSLFGLLSSSQFQLADSVINDSELVAEANFNSCCHHHDKWTADCPAQIDFLPQSQRERDECDCSNSHLTNSLLIATITLVNQTNKFRKLFNLPQFKLSCVCYMLQTFTFIWLYSMILW